MRLGKETDERKRLWGYNKYTKKGKTGIDGRTKKKENEERQSMEKMFITVSCVETLHGWKCWGKEEMKGEKRLEYSKIILCQEDLIFCDNDIQQCKLTME